MEIAKKEAEMSENLKRAMHYAIELRLQHLIVCVVGFGWKLRRTKKLQHKAIKNVIRGEYFRKLVSIKRNERRDTLQ